MYERFPISDFRNGMVRGKAPWLAPTDAFPTLINGRVNLGVLEKRLGYSLLATTGAGLPIMGIHESRYEGVPRILVIDTKRLYTYDIIADTLTDLSLANTYTGTDYDYFKFCDYYEKTYFVQGVNGIDYWDDSDDSIHDIVTAGAVAIATCRGLFMFKDRLHFVAPTIGATFYPNRIYYSDVGLTTITNATQYYTYAREDTPVAYQAIDMENMLVMGHKSSWRVQYTGDSTTPFTCKTLDATQSCLTPHVLIEYHNPSAGGRLIATLSNTQFVAFDGYQWRKIDWPIRDFTTEMAMRYLYYAQGTKAGGKESLYITYPDTNDTYPTHVLEYNITENNWADHLMTLHTIAGISGEVKPSDYSLAAGMIGRAASGYTYAGDRSGNLFLLDSGGDDNGSDIAFTAKSAALNPYHQQGHRTYLGWLEVYTDNDATASFTMNLYKDDLTTAYKTVPVSCSGAGDRFWQRVNVGGEIGTFHRIEITNTDSSNRPRIHAIVPWFKRGGRISITSSVSSDWPNNTWRLHTESGVTYIQRKDSGVWTNYQTWGA